MNESIKSRSTFVFPPIPDSMTKFVNNLSEDQQNICKNMILWENTPDVNNKCKINSMDDAYNLIKCTQPNICDNYARGRDRSNYCKMTNCTTVKKTNDNNNTIDNTEQINNVILKLLMNQNVGSNTSRCNKSIQNLLHINKLNNDQILFINKMNPNINQNDIAHTWLMCNASMLCEKRSDLRCDTLTSLLKTPDQFSQGLKLNGINQNGAIYQLDDYYDGGELFDRFSFIQGLDPTNGFNYNISKIEALREGLFTYNDVIKYDHPHKQCVVKVSGVVGEIRKSVKLESQKSYNGGLFVLDIDHMPSGLSVWSIFSLAGKNWPCDGEIRIGQTVNSIDWDSSQNLMALHTEQFCTQDEVPGITNSGICGSGRQYQGNRICRPCNRNNGNDCPYGGCGKFAGPGTCGDSFNKQGGGVFACEWILDGTIKIWIFPRLRVPEYVPFYADKLDVSKWPAPHVEFKSCVGSFKNNYITLSTTLCGDRGEEYFIIKKAGSCESYVADPKSNFNDAKWVINYLKVFQKII